MTQLRQKMIRQMQLRDLSENTQRGYLQAITALAKHYMLPPDQLSPKMLEDYLLHLKNDLGRAPKTCGVFKAAFGFFYHDVLSNEEMKINFSIKRNTRKLPVVLSQDEVLRIINAPRNIKHRLLLMTTYSAGLRISEVVVLKPEHIDRNRMLIKIENGKGTKERYSLLSEMLLKELQVYYKSRRPKQWLFPAERTGVPIATRTLYRIYEKAREKAGVKKGSGPHTLRHSFATHLLEAGYDIRKIQVLMGHKSLSATIIYLHVSQKTLSQIKSPLDLISTHPCERKEGENGPNN